MTERNARKQLICLVAMTFVVAFAAYPSHSQLIQPSGVAQPSTLNVQHADDLQFGYSRDVISGNNSRGPYALTWKNIRPGRETVLIDGRRAVAGLDYNIDPAKGFITFTEPLRATSVARVDYALDTEKSQRNEGGLNIPLFIDIVSDENTNLQFSSIYRQETNRSGSRGQAVLGLSGGHAFSGDTNISSNLFLSPGAGNLLDGAGGRIGVNTQVRGVQIKGGFSYAGQSFAGAREANLKAGQDAQELSLVWKPAESRAAYTACFQNVNQYGGGGRDSARMDQKFTYQISPGSQFLFSRLNTATDASGSQNEAVTDLYQFTRQFNNGSTKLLVEWTDTEKVTQGDASSAHLAQSQNIRVESSAIDKMTIRTHLRRSDDSLLGETNALDVNLAARPLQIIELEAGIKGSESESEGTDQSGVLRLSARTPDDRYRLSTGITDRQRQQTGIRSHDIALEARPSDRLSISGGYTFSDSGVDQLTVKEMAGAASPFDFLKLNGLYKERELVDDQIITLNLNASLQPMGALGVVAAVAQNPEDSKGNIQRFHSHSLGLKANIGVLSISGDYAVKDEYLLGREWLQTRLGLGVKLAQSTSITGDYEYSQTDSAWSESTRRMTLGVRRDLGSDFNLWFRGSMIDRENPAASQRTSYEAEMKLGVRF